jgi:hypothetical protein
MHHQSCEKRELSEQKHKLYVLNTWLVNIIVMWEIITRGAKTQIIKYVISKYFQYVFESLTKLHHYFCDNSTSLHVNKEKVLNLGPLTDKNFHTHMASSINTEMFCSFRKRVGYSFIVEHQLNIIIAESGKLTLNSYKILFIILKFYFSKNTERNRKWQFSTCLYTIRMNWYSSLSNYSYLNTKFISDQHGRERKY